jgi:hypothetical protein
MSQLTWSPYPRYLQAQYQSFKEIAPRRTIVAADNVICTPNIACTYRIPRTDSVHLPSSHRLTSCISDRTSKTPALPNHRLLVPAPTLHAQPPTLPCHWTQHRTAQSNPRRGTPSHYSCPLAPISYPTTKPPSHTLLILLPPSHADVLTPILHNLCSD